MKTRMIIGIAAFSLIALSCNREEDDTFNAKTAKISAQIDAIADDVSVIAEEEYANQENAGRIANAQALLPACATVTTTFTDDTWTSTISFDTSCALANGNVVSGNIIVSGSTNFDSDSYVVNYTFDNFYHNDRQVQGNRTVTFTWESTPAQAEAHTVANIDLDFIVTYPGGNSYTRTGHRVRELIQGYDTPFNWLDNVYQVSGQWATVFASGTLTTTIGTPLIYYTTCPYIGAGTLNLSTESNSATLDYGDGTCDYFATLTVNGGSETTILLNQ